jgi:hypothetical protein
VLARHAAGLLVISLLHIVRMQLLMTRIQPCMGTCCCLGCHQRCICCGAPARGWLLSKLQSCSCDTPTGCSTSTAEPLVALLPAKELRATPNQLRCAWMAPPRHVSSKPPTLQGQAHTTSGLRKSHPNYASGGHFS